MHVESATFTPSSVIGVFQTIVFFASHAADLLRAKENYYQHHHSTSLKLLVNITLKGSLSFIPSVTLCTPKCVWVFFSLLRCVCMYVCVKAGCRPADRPGKIVLILECQLKL